VEASRDVPGLWTLRSLVECACRRRPSIAAKRGAVNITRRATDPQAGQSHGSADCTMGRMASKTPQLAH